MDGRVCRIPCLLFCRWVVWRSREPSWWPIASLVSLMCTHRWARPTQWTNVAHRVVLRKGSSRLLFFPHAHSHSLIPRVSPSSMFRRLVRPSLLSFSVWLRRSLLHRDLSFSMLLFVHFFSFFLVVRRWRTYFFVVLSLIVARCVPLLYFPRVWHRRLLLSLSTFRRFLLLNRWVFSGVLHVRRHRRKTGSCVVLPAFFLPTLVLVFFLIKYVRACLVFTLSRFLSSLMKST